MNERIKNTDKVTTKPPKYGFYGRLKSEFPSQINVDITEVCNLACVHCPHPSFKNSQQYAARYMPFELNEKMIDEVKNTKDETVQYIRYTSNGEPLIHPDAYTMIEDAVKHSGVFVTLTTNGTIMNERRIQRLLDAGVHLIDISIDAYKDETYSKIRLNGDLRITRNNVLNLIRWIKESKSKTKVVVSFVEQKKNIGEVHDFKKFWESNGADYVIIRRLHSASGTVSRIADKLNNDIQNVIRRPCLYPWERIILNAKGFLSFCPTDWMHKSEIIDYRKTTIKEVWQGLFYVGLRDAHIDNDFRCHDFCGQCPDWQQTRWPDEGRGYADLIEEINNEEI